MKQISEQTEYKVLARKYRPQTFNDLIGQDILVKTLTNSIINNRIAHAYLLTGVRGVGKTTTARLIGMSLNCNNLIEKSCEPCGTCDSCNSVRSDHNLDVIEMDAASKTGIDDIREIIDNIKYKPVNSKYKIFIIDEVHMLSKSAFNALLKTLEEPPSHIKFIFATTEVKKIPITIISRCQRFDLHRIENNTLSFHLESISKKENVNINKEATSLIVRSADGSVRDALSLLDQAISNEIDQITAKSIIDMLGLADRNNIFDLLDKIFNGDAPNALKIFSKLHNSGADIVMIFSEMLNVIHFITQIKISPELKEDIHIPEFERKKGFEIASKISMNSLGIVWQVLFKGYEELQNGYHLYQHGEMIIIRLIYLHKGPNPDDLIKKFDNEIEKIKDKNLSNKTLVNNTQNQTKEKIDNLSNNLDFNNSVKENIDSYPKNTASISVESFRHFVDLFYQKREAMLHTYLYNNARLIFFKEGDITINAKSIVDPHFTRTIAKLVSKWTGRIWQVNSSTSNMGQTLYEEDLIIQQKEIENMKNETDIKEILDSFPGVKIHSITDINETSKESEFEHKLKEKKE